MIIGRCRVLLRRQERREVRLLGIGRLQRERHAVQRKSVVGRSLIELRPRMGIHVAGEGRVTAAIDRAGNPVALRRERRGRRDYRQRHDGNGPGERTLFGHPWLQVVESLLLEFWRLPEISHQAEIVCA